MIGGANERQVVELFANFQLVTSSSGEPSDSDIANRVVVIEEELEVEDESKYIPQRRYAYSREYKLAAINYF
jgi:hypothetical protein